MDFHDFPIILGKFSLDPVRKQRKLGQLCDSWKVLRDVAEVTCLLG